MFLREGRPERYLFGEAPQRMFETSLDYVGGAGLGAADRE